jgi:hypothetical protein
MQGEGAMSGGDGEREIDRICGTFEKVLKKMLAYFAVLRLLGERVSEADLDKLRETAQSVLETIDEQGRW